MRISEKRTQAHEFAEKRISDHGTRTWRVDVEPFEITAPGDMTEEEIQENLDIYLDEYATGLRMRDMAFFELSPGGDEEENSTPEETALSEEGAIPPEHV
jgi:hypothetical protein